MVAFARLYPDFISARLLVQMNRLTSLRDVVRHHTRLRDLDLLRVWSTFFHHVRCLRQKESVCFVVFVPPGERNTEESTQFQRISLFVGFTSHPGECLKEVQKQK